MSEPKNALIQSRRTITDLINSPRAREEIAKVLPRHLTPERMTRVALTATLRNPALLSCRPESLMNALLICSQAGLEPDGRLAHLIPFGDQVQVIFDYKGLVALALRNGAEAVYADKVCERDAFEAGVIEGHKALTHKPDWSKPRGTPYCYYAVTKRSGEVDWEVMSLEEIQAIRKRSRAANNGPWVTDFDEMAKKTVLRRMSKRWDLLPEIRDIINADDDNPEPLNVPVISRPVFDGPALPENGTTEPAPATPEPAPATPAPAPATQQPAAATPAPAAATPAAEPAVPAVPAGAFNPLRGVRNLAKMSRIKEAELLDFLATIGKTDGSAGTLEDLMLSANGPAILLQVAEEWPDIVAKMKGRTE